MFYSTAPGEETDEVKVKAMFSGAAAGITNGLLGSGGGAIIFPLYLRWLKLDEKRALATSIMTMVPLCGVSLIIYAIGGRLVFMQALPYLIGSALGGFLGGKLFKKVPAKWLRRGFGALIAAAGVLLWR